MVASGAKLTVKHTNKFFEQFKTFIETRDVVDVAVAFVIGLAFREVCRALADDIFGLANTYSSN